MSDITAKTFPKNKPNRFLKDLPKHLKDPANYEKIQKALLENLATTHSHADILTWSNCFDCRQKLRNHAEMMRKLGFKTPGHYLAWKKTMEFIHGSVLKRDRLPKYNDK